MLLALADGGAVVVAIIGALSGAGGVVAYVKARGERHRADAEAVRVEAAASGEMVSGTYRALYGDLLRRVEQTERSETQCRENLQAVQEELLETRDQLRAAKAKADEAALEARKARMEVVAMQDRLDAVESKQEAAGNSQALVADLQRTVADVQARLRSIANGTA